MFVEDYLKLAPLRSGCVTFAAVRLTKKKSVVKLLGTQGAVTYFYPA